MNLKPALSGVTRLEPYCICFSETLSQTPPEERIPPDWIWSPVQNTLRIRKNLKQVQNVPIPPTGTQRFCGVGYVGEEVLFLKSSPSLHKLSPSTGKTPFKEHLLGKSGAHVPSTALNF